MSWGGSTGAAIGSYGASTPTVSGGGGGIVVVSASVPIGPDYGGAGGADGVTSAVGVDHAFVSLAIEGGSAVGLAHALDALAVATRHGIGIAHDLTDLSLAVALAVGIAHDLADVAVTLTQAVGMAHDLSDVTVETAQAVGLAHDLTDVSVAGGQAAGVKHRARIQFSQPPAGDTYLDEADGTSSFGSASPIFARAPNVLTDNEQIAYLWWDLTAHAGLQANANATVRLWSLDADGLVGVPVGWELYRAAAEPMGESTATWDADEPPAGTLLDSGTITSGFGGGVGAPGYVEATITVAQADLDAALSDGWMYVRIVGDTTPVTGLGNQISVRSKEDATTGERPRCDLDLRTGT